MAQLYDDLGRLVEGQKTTNLSLQEIKGLIATSATKAVGDAKPFAKGGDAAPNDKLVKLFETYTKDFQDSVKEQKDYLKQMVDVLKEIAQSKSEEKDNKDNKDKKDKKPDGKKAKDKKPVKDKDAPKASVWRDLGKFARAGLEKNSISVHDTACEGVLRQINDVLQRIETGLVKIPSGGGGGGGGGGGPTPVPGGEPTPVPADGSTGESLKPWLEREKAARNLTSILEDQILGIRVFSSLTEGILDKEREFVQEARKISYEIAGATKDQVQLMRTFEDIDKTAKLTGKSRQDFIVRYTKTLRMGIKDLKKAHAITVAQLNTEEQLGIKAGELGDTFVDWTRHLKFNEGQIGDMGRGMRDVARFTGMTGDALKEVVESSKQYIDNLKNAGTATAAQVKNIIELSANFKKVGIDGDKLMGAMTSTNKLLAANTSTFALLAKAANQAGVYGKLFSGTLLQSKAAMKGMNKEFMRTINQFGVAGNSAEEIRANWEKLSDQAKARINIQLKAAFDVEAGELMGTIEAFEQSSQTLADKLANVNKKLQQNLTLEEKAAVLEEQRKLKLSASMGALTALDEAAKSAKNMGDALAKFSTRRGEFEKDMNALGVAWTSEADVARGAIQSAMDSVNKGLKAAGKQELKIDSSEIERALKDPAAFRELTAKITKAEQEASTAAKAQLDPLSSAAQSLREMNDTLRNLANAGFSAIFNSSFGQLLIIAGVIAAGIIGVVGLIGTLYHTMAEIRTLITGETKHEQEQANILRGLSEMARTKGSLYTHDHVAEKQRDKIGTGLLKQMGNIASLLATIKDCICALKNSPSTAATAAPAAAAKQGEAKPTAVEKSIRRHQEKQIKIEKRENKLKSANIKQESKNVKAEKALKSKELKKQASAPVGDVDPGVIDEMGGSFMENAAAIATLAVGVLALGAAIIFLGKKILDLLGLDEATVMQTAATVAAVAAAGGAIAFGAVQLYKELDTSESKEFASGVKENYKEMAKMAIAVALIGPALVLLGAAIIWMVNKITNAFGLDLSTVAETAVIVGAIAAAAGLIAYGVSEAVECLEKLKESPLLKGDLNDMLWTIGKGGLALLILAPAIVLLASAIIWMSSKILGAFGLDAGTAAMVALDVAAIIGAAGVIALGVIGASIPLYFLGAMMWDGGMSTLAMAGLMALGAVALLILTPAILLLAMAIIKMSSALMAAAGVDLAMGAETAMNTAGVIVAAGVIAGAVLVSGWALSLLGAAMTTGAFWLMAGLAALGAIAILAITPAIVALGVAILKMGEAITVAAGLDLSVAKKIAEDTAGVIVAAGVIAGAVLASGWALSLLGTAVITGAFWSMALMAAIGAVAILAITPAIIKLAMAIIDIAQGVMGKGMDPAVAAKVADDVADIIKSAGSIAASVIAAGAGLAALGYMLYTPLFWAGLGFMALGAIALTLLTPVMIGLASAIINMAKKSMTVTPEEGQKIADAVASVIDSAGRITDSILGQMGSLVKLGLLSILSWLIIPLMWAGLDALNSLSEPVIAYIGTVVDIAKKIGGKISPDQAIEMAKGVADILGACGQITEEIFKAKDRLLNMPVYGGFWSWLVGSKVADRMREGVIALSDLAGPVGTYIQTVVRIAKQMASSLNPKEATEMAKGVAAILGACGEVTEEIFKAKDKLLNVPVYGGFWAWLTGSKVAGRMREGVIALSDLAGPVGTYIQTVVRIAKQMGGSLNPKQATEMAKGVAAIIGACGEVTDEIMKASDKIMSISYSKGFWLVALSTVGAMNRGIDTLDTMKQPMTRYIATVVGIAKDLGAKLDPKQSIEMAKGVAAILAACGEVTDEIMKASDKIILISYSKGFWWLASSTVDAMNRGTDTLDTMKQPMTRYVGTVVSIAKDLGAKLNPKQTVSMARGVAAILSACGEVTDQIMKASDKIMSISYSKGFWIVALSTVDAMNQGTDTLDTMKQPMTRYVGTVVDFAKSLQAQVDLKAAKNMVNLLYMISMIVSLTAKVLNDLGTKITPLTQGSFFASSPIEQMEEARRKMAVFFPKMIMFISTIVNQVENAFGNIKELKNAAKSLKMMAVILQAALPAIQIMVEKIAPLTQGGVFTASPIEKIKEAIPQFNGFFTSVGNFVKSIIDGIQNFKDAKELKNAAKTMLGMALMLRATSIALLSLTAIMGLMDGGFFTASPVEKIRSNKDVFATWFQETVNFVKTGILAQISGLSDVKSLQNAALIMKSLAIVLCSTRVAIQSLSSVMAVMDGGFFTDSPAKKIEKNKGEFTTWFAATAKFVNDGIVNAVIKEFGDPKQIIAAAMIMRAMAIVARSTVPVIKNLADAMALMDGGFFSDSPVEKIIKNKEDFRKYFEQIGKFMHTGIVNPVIAEFGDPNQIVAAARIVSAMAVIAKGIVPMIKNLAAVMALMDGGLLSDSPIDKIIENRKEFAKWFRQIARFMLYGIVVPILTILPDAKEIQTAARIISAMAVIVKAIPRVIKSLAYELIPLMDSGDSLSDTPADKLAGNTVLFRRWFTGIARFMLNGIVVPILTQLPEPKTIMLAGRILSAMYVIVRSLPRIIGGLAKLLVPLNPNDCMGDAPIAVLAAGVEQFKAWFRSITSFLREGIIIPIIESLPSNEEIQSAETNLAATIAILKQVPPFLSELAPAVNDVLWTIIDNPLLEIKTAIISDYFNGIADSLMNGIINPIKLFPSLEELTEIVGQLDGMTETVKQVPPFLSGLAPAVNDVFWIIISNPFLGVDTAIISSYFKGIADSLVNGIIDPIKLFPSSEELTEVVRQLDGMTETVKKVALLLNNVSTELGPLVTGWWWNSVIFLGVKTAIFSRYFKGIAASLVNGIINPIKQFFPSSEELTEVVGQLDGMAETVKKVALLLNNVSTELGPLVTGWWWFSPIAKIGRQTDNFADYFSGIASALNTGILEPIKKHLPPSSEIQEAAARISALAEVMSGLKDALQMLSEVMQDIRGMRIDVELLKTLPLAELAALEMNNKMTEAGGGAAAGGKSVNAGSPTEQVQDDKVARKEQEAATSLSKDMDQFMITAITPGNGLYVTDLMLIDTIKKLFKQETPTEVVAKVEQPKTDISTDPTAAVAGTIPANVANPTVTPRVGGDPLSEARRQALQPAMTRDQIQPAMSTVQRGQQTLQQAQSQPNRGDRIRQALQSRPTTNEYLERGGRNASRREAERSAERDSIRSAEQRIEQEHQRSNPTVRAEQPATATNPQVAVHPPTADVHQQVRQNAASSEPAASQISSPELSELAQAASTENDLQEQMVSLLEQILKIFKGGESSKAGSSEANVGDTAANKVGQKPTNYYRWAAGKHFQSSGKQILNIGSQIV